MKNSENIPIPQFSVAIMIMPMRNTELQLYMTRQ